MLSSVLASFPRPAGEKSKPGGRYFQCSLLLVAFQVAKIRSSIVWRPLLVKSEHSCSKRKPFVLLSCHRGRSQCLRPPSLPPCRWGPRRKKSSKKAAIRGRRERLLSSLSTSVRRGVSFVRGGRGRQALASYATAIALT
ncbi:hypothetical protein NDU88_006331 [Pleurodeles waltl]|uniref:Uncharacterized protein n=1 Tax=Pleurodeles waltl TaxID=8319 RepID=A0AAV7PN53_PLEWA|nr:hypothetical protein NDU88_006331 [Pleurodeles waltl]